MSGGATPNQEFIAQASIGTVPVGSADLYVLTGSQRLQLKRGLDQSVSPIAEVKDLTSYLPLTGGTMLGGIDFNSTNAGNINSLSYAESTQANFLEQASLPALSSNIDALYAETSTHRIKRKRGIDQSTDTMVEQSDLSAYAPLSGATFTGNIDMTGHNLSNANLVSCALGTPSSGNLSNCTGVPAGSITGIDPNAQAWLVNPTSANLAAAVVTTSTGNGALTFANAATLTNTVLSTPASGNLSNCTAFPQSQLSGLATNVSTFLGTCNSTTLFNALVTKSGSGGNVVFTQGPTLVAPALGTVASGTTFITSCFLFCFRQHCCMHWLPNCVRGKFGRRDRYVPHNTFKQ
jgi:hypothetical protein